jgi:tRNA pseudouridine32 synthase/23S rRNA pseudouridine746 synthase
MTPKAPLTPEEIAAVRAMVVAQDDQILVLSKPAGLSSQGARGGVNSLEDMLAAFARSNGKRPHLVHRLDRDTSGVILAAKTKPALGHLGKEIAARRVKKTYLALVAPGAPVPPSGVIEAPLRRVEQGREVFMRACEADDADAQASKSVYRTLLANERAALVELSPHTGRMHQLRVHMAHIDRPLLGDARYGGALRIAGTAVPRLMLHAWKLEFRHPDGKPRHFIVPPPADFEMVAEALDLAISRP